MYDEAVEIPLKKLFAAALLRKPDNPFEAAREIEPTDHIGRASYIVQNWVHDPIVKAEQDRLIALMGPLSKVPTKEQFAYEVYDTGRQAKTVAEKLKAWEFFADIVGYVEKGGTRGGGTNVNIINNNGVVNRIMPVPAFASESEWERTAIQYQETQRLEHG